jgi:hypothetical protein
MAMKRRIFQPAILGASSALAGWALSEYLAVRHGITAGRFDEALTCSLVGGAIGFGLSFGPGLSSVPWKEQAQRALMGWVTGVLAGAIGVSLGNLFLGTLHWGRAIGWTVMGAGIGLAEGLYARSPRTIRTGVLAASSGGLLFGPVSWLLSSWSSAASRGASFALLGLFIGTPSGLAKVSAGDWRTLVEGFRSRWRTWRARPKAAVPDATASPVPPPVASPPRPAPAPVARTPAGTGSGPSTPAKPARPLPRGVSLCPKCQRAVLGARPYCVHCKLSF